MRGEISFKGKVSPGQVVVCCLDNVGILVGKVNEITPRGILLDFLIRESRREKLAARLDWHAAHAVRAAQLRRAPRIVSLHPMVERRLAETVSFTGTILDISLSGAAIVLRPNPGLIVGTLLRVAGRSAPVVRAIEDGVAVQFVELFSTDAFDRWVKL
ncbi:MAG: PilZ domain-containing protein [Microvirga sp.]